MTWKPAAGALANRVAAESAWHAAVAATPRHLLVPNWWIQDGPHWRLMRGERDQETWIDAAYDDRTMVTQVGDLHADKAGDDARPLSPWPPASSSTLPSLVLRMFDIAGVKEGMRVLDLGTGSGYSSALLAHRLGDEHVTSVDVDGYLVEAARQRLAAFGRHPATKAIDATSSILGEGFDAAVAMFSTRTIPRSWLAAVRPRGVISTTLAGTSLHLRVTVTDDQRAHGEVVSHDASFMRARDGSESGREMDAVYMSARTAEGDETTALVGGLPDLWKDWRLGLVLELLEPGVEHRSIDLEDRSMVWLLHPLGSWARAEVPRSGRAVVHASGPRDLWGQLERARHLAAEHGPMDPLSLRMEITAGSQCMIWPAAGLVLPL